FCDFLDLAPLLHQRAPALRITFAGFVQSDDPVDAEVTEIATQFAPRREHTRTLEKRQRDRPYRAAGVLTRDVGVVEHDHLLGTDGAADRGKVETLLAGVATREGNEAYSFDIVA